MKRLCLLSLCLVSCLAVDQRPTLEDAPLFEARQSQELVFSSPEESCAECHPQHVEEWRISNHAYAAKDPVFHAMVRLGQKQSEGALGQFCIQCHSPIGMASGQTTVFQDPVTGDFQQNTEDLDPIAETGVSCDVCHTVSSVIEPLNARVVYTPNGTRRATISDPVETPAHASQYSELHKKSELCGVCHAVTNPKGALVEETFAEWERSSHAQQNKTCQGCHMPEYAGQAATEGPQRKVHRHLFVGVDVSLLPEEEFPGYQEMRALTAQLLQESATLRASFNGNRIDLSIENLAGHALPSGATAERQMWVELKVRNEQGEVVFESGTLDPNEDIRDGVEGHSQSPGSDPQLLYFGQQLVKIAGMSDAESETEKEALRTQASSECTPISVGAVAAGGSLTPVSFPWQADWQCNYMIPPDGVATHSYDLSQLAPGDYSASVRLLFRTFPPYFLRKLEALAELDEAVKARVPTVEMAAAQLSLTISAP